MKNLVILGAGSGGTMLANRMRRRMPAGWEMTVVDPEATHLYQPGLLFLPFGARDEEKIQRPRRRTLAGDVNWVRQTVDRVDPDTKTVAFEGGESITYDVLVIASGARTRPDETPGLKGDEWRRSIHDFYTLGGARALRDALAGFEGGRLVLNVVEMPIKCPVAPMEFLFLADEYFTRKGIRDKVELVYATPLDGAFTRPQCNSVLSYLIKQKGITIQTDFGTGEVDAEGHKLVAYDEQEIPYDLLVSIPVHGGARFVESSGLGNELGFVPTHKNTLRAKQHEDIFVLGDATDLPSSKAGSVAHFQSEVLEENLLKTMAGRSLEEGFDGHANCFIETGFGKAILIDFNYDTEPLSGTFPLPGVGPMTLLAESRLNHLGKLAFRWVYWNMLLPGRPIPLVEARMSMRGKSEAAPALPAPEQV
jgi:sulfide:quinone oxidoreductase